MESAGYDPRSIYFPQHSSIMETDNAVAYAKHYIDTEYFFHNAYARNGKHLWLAGRLPRDGGSRVILCDLEKRSFTLALKDRSSSISIVFPYIVTFSASFVDGRGFLMTVYAIDTSNRLSEITTAYTDFFISDAESIGQFLLMAGSDRANKKDRVDVFSIRTKRLTSLFSVPKEKGTIKIVRSGNRALAYYSSTTEKLKTTRAFIISRKAKRRAGFEWKEIDAGNSDFDFFGKGCYVRDEFIIPAIDEKKGTRFGVFCLVGDSSIVVQRWIQAPTGMYTIHSVTDQSVIFTGYNYFASKTDFFLVRLDLDQQKEQPFTTLELPTEVK